LLEGALWAWHDQGGLRRWVETPSTASLADALVFDRPEILWRASGLARGGLVIQLSSPRLGARLGVGIETPLAHAIVDHLLGFSRPFAEIRHQLSPVEWGIWTFLAAEALDHLDPGGDSSQPGEARTIGVGDWSLDRVGPDAFDITGMGSILTIRWPARLGRVAAAVRLWLPETLAPIWLESVSSRHVVGPQSDPVLSTAPAAPETHRRISAAAREYGSDWRAQAGGVELPRGLRSLRMGGVLPLTDGRLSGSPKHPEGEIRLVLEPLDGKTRIAFPAQFVDESAGCRVTLTGPLQREPSNRRAYPLNFEPPSSPTSAGSAQPAASTSATPSPLDAPVTLTVELGRINLSLGRLADLKPGDLIELDRHSREPVELTSNGRLVARGELIRIDTELAVRVLSVFL
jgi:type III secretion system YscQ/HrcQ family protein